MTVTARPAMLAAEGRGCGSTAATPKAAKPQHQVPQHRDRLAGIGWTAAGPGHSALATGWIVTVIGGYALRWRWTGYPGHTLWDWLGMLLPLVFPAILLPPLLNWVSGNAAGRASAAY